MCPADAATKSYVDTQDALKLSLAGGTMAIREARKSRARFAARIIFSYFYEKVNKEKENPRI